MDQTHSVFMPGLTRRGPVYNALGAMPVLSPNTKLAIQVGLFLAGVVFKKIPAPVALGAALLVWKLFPDTASAPVASTTPPNVAPPDFSNYFSTLPIPTVGIPV